MIKFESEFWLRTWTSGCYYYEQNLKIWTSMGMVIREAHYPATWCRSDHLTAFAAGFFVVPHELNFNLVFAKASFTDNMTIYFTVILSLIIYLVVVIWGRFHDLKDEKRLASRPLIDNDPLDHYLYEILTFTGQWRESSCNSKVEIVVVSRVLPTSKIFKQTVWHSNR